MPGNYTNTAKTKNDDTQSNSARNCSLCTAAGAVNLYIGDVVCQTRDVAKFFMNKDNKYGMGDNLTAQTKHIDEFVSRMIKTNGIVYLSPNSIKGKDKAAAERWMLDFPNRSVFAVYVTGTTPYGNANNKGLPSCHWLNAVKAGGTIRYFDYQVCRNLEKQMLASPMNPASSINPFIGVQSQVNATIGPKGVEIPTHKQFHGPNQPGTFINPQFISIIGFTNNRFSK